jgi:hypothetical protein
MPRHAFYSFHYQPDNWRASQVRNIGVVDGNKPAHDNDWETVKRGGDAAIERWIREQMKGRSCTVVLVGAQTAQRKWIDFEIIESWKTGMGVCAIHVHGLKDSDGRTASKGANPFQHLSLGQKPFSEVVRCYDPLGYQSTDIYAWISANLSAIVEESVSIRGDH